MAQLERDMASPEVKATLDENLKLAEQLGLNGTPSYVVGSDVVVGAVGLDGAEGQGESGALRDRFVLTTADGNSRSGFLPQVRGEARLRRT